MEKENIESIIYDYIVENLEIRLHTNVYTDSPTSIKIELLLDNRVICEQTEQI